MTETPPETTREPPENAPTEDDASRFDDAARVVAWIGVALATLIAIVALFRFYGHSTAAIEQLAPSAHADLFLAGFNLAVLLVAGAAVLALVRRLSADDLL